MVSKTSSRDDESNTAARLPQHACAPDEHGLVPGIKVRQVRRIRPGRGDCHRALTGSEHDMAHTGACAFICPHTVLPVQGNRKTSP